VKTGVIRSALNKAFPLSQECQTDQVVPENRLEFTASLQRYPFSMCAPKCLADIRNGPERGVFHTGHHA